MRRNCDHAHCHPAANHRFMTTLLLLLAIGLAALIVGPADAAGTANESGCPNKGLRLAFGWTMLPDCRGYEMVSPPYKEGYPVLVSSFAPDGNSAIADSLGAMAGNNGSSEVLATGEAYMASRTVSGWRFSPLNAPLSEFVGEFMVSAEAARGETLWMQHTPEQGAHETGFYIRLPSGVFDYIGPTSPPPSSREAPSNVAALEPFEVDNPKAATDDYSHVLLSAEYPGTAWPFDKTPVSEPSSASLYEYSGLDNPEPTLVGVTGARGSTQLIALCGTGLGAGESGSSFNALSRDGESIFFTVNPCSPGPKNAEIYARLHGAVNGVGPAETVHVSASECAPACEGESGKNFEGASEDGRLVFFTSTQKLTDEAVNGTESGNSASEEGCATTVPEKGGCNLYLYDFQPEGGAHLTTVSIGGEVLGVVGIAEDGSRVYYVSRTAIDAAGTSVTGSTPKQGMPNLYVYDVVHHKTSYVVTFGSENGDRKDWSRAFRRPAQIAGESGRYMIFMSSTPGITPDDTSSLAQLFEYRAEEDGEQAELVRVTKGEGAYNADGNSVAIGIAPSTILTRNTLLGQGQDFKTSANRLDISSDGKRVFFLTAGQLSPRATSAANGCESLYEFDSSGRLSEGTVHLVSDGQDTQLYRGALCGLLFQGIDATGANVLFSTGDPLVPTDVDGLGRDTYDARVEGGFDPPFAAGACGLGACEGASSAPPAPPVAGEATPTVISTSTSASPHARTRSHTSKRAAGNKRLRRALRACRGRPHARRNACERAARKQFGSKLEASRAGRTR
jgi:hypothetical protein